MDSVKAAALENDLQGKEIGEWKIERLINHGKSAAVFLGTKDSEQAAIKIFDDELIAKYGDDQQVARIERELTLVGKTHPHLVRILSGGVDTHTKNHYIVMEYLPHKNMKECLGTIPIEDISLYIGQIASAANFLEQQDLVHRDVKPENIVVDLSNKMATLLDLGVVRYIGKKGLTDGDGVLPFIGTLQYSSPEFLLREEKDSLDGWQALTFYQLGAVLHDLIMKRPIFAEYEEPYARLVNAVQFVDPEIQNSLVPSDLIDLARCCLLKKPQDRLELVQWSDLLQQSKSTPARTAKQRVTTRVLLTLASKQNAKQIEAQAKVSEGEENTLIYEIINFLKISIRSIKNDNKAFPQCKISADKDRIPTICIKFNSSSAHKIATPLTILVTIQIISTRAKAIRIFACRAQDGKTVVDVSNPSLVIYKGVYDGNQVYSALEDFLYEELDCAQSSDDPGSS